MKWQVTNGVCMLPDAAMFGAASPNRDLRSLARAGVVREGTHAAEIGYETMMRSDTTTLGFGRGAGGTNASEGLAAHTADPDYADASDLIPQASPNAASGGGDYDAVNFDGAARFNGLPANAVSIAQLYDTQSATDAPVSLYDVMADDGVGAAPRSVQMIGGSAAQVPSERTNGASEVIGEINRCAAVYPAGLLSTAACLPAGCIRALFLPSTFYTPGSIFVYLLRCLSVYSDSTFATCVVYPQAMLRPPCTRRRLLGTQVMPLQDRVLVRPAKGRKVAAATSRLTTPTRPITKPYPTGISRTAMRQWKIGVPSKAYLGTLCEFTRANYLLGLRIV